MRIVGGRLSGRRFAGPRGVETRPTSERVREAVASALDARDRVEGAVILDAWAGTGAMSFELLSRGAERATLVERDRKMSAAIERAAEALGLSQVVRVLRADLARPVADGLRGAEPDGFDVVFCDPPYAEVERAPTLLGELLDAGLLREDACVVIEHATRDRPSLPRGLAEVKTYRYGDTSVLLGERERA